MSEIVIRLANEADLDQVVSCQALAWREAYAGVISDGDLSDQSMASRRRERWKRRIQGERHVIIALKDDEVVGVSSCAPRKDDDVEVPRELKSLYVRKAWWRQGIGRRLLDECLGHSAAYLWVYEQSVRARGFYAQLGFRPDGAGELDDDTGLWEVRFVRHMSGPAVRMAASGIVDYKSDVDDNTRWADFAQRDGDIVISTRSKSGTTWMQMICALLVFQTRRLPAPLAELSPWLDHLVVPQDELFARLAGQRHRRIIKTHTPLDGIKLDDRTTYLVVARQPIDLAVSLYHQGDNLDRARIAELAGLPAPESPPPKPPVREWLLEWIDEDTTPHQSLDSLPGVLAHVADGQRRVASGNVSLFRYEDLLDDLDGQMRFVAEVLGIAVDATVWPELVGAATLDEMKANLDSVIPDPDRIFKDRSAFFKRGTSGAGRELLSDDEYDHYRDRVRELSSPALDAWLHRTS